MRSQALANPAAVIAEGDAPLQLRVLLLHQSPSTARAIEQELRRGGAELEIRLVRSQSAYLAELEGWLPDVILAAGREHGFTTAHALELRNRHPVQAPFMIVGGSDASAGACWKLGARRWFDPADLGELRRAIMAMSGSRGHEARARLRREDRVIPFERLPVGAFVTSPDGRIMASNRALRKLLGFGSEEAFNERGARVVYADPARREEVVRRLLGEGHVDGYEVALTRADGSQLYVSLSARLRPAGPEGGLEIEGVAIDIDQQVRDRQRLEQSEGFLRQVIDTATDAIMGMDRRGRITDWNPRAEDMFGWSAAEAIGQELESLLIPEATRTDYRRRLAPPQEGEPRVAGTIVDGLRALRRDGSEFPVEVSVSSPIQTADGVRIVGFVRDVGQRLAAQERARQSQERLRGVLTAASVIVACVDSQGILTFLDGNILPALPEQLIGQRIQDLFGNNPDIMKSLERSQAGEDYLVELPLDGHVYQARTTPERDSGGQVIGAMAVVLEITEVVEARREVEELGRERLLLADRLALLLESIDEGVYMLDADGVCTYANGAAAAILGYRPDELLNQRMHDLIHHSHPDGRPYPFDECSVSAVSRTGRGYSARDDYLWRKDGSGFNTVYSVYPLEGAGGHSGEVVIFQDSTERVLAMTHVADRARHHEALLSLARTGLVSSASGDIVAEAARVAARALEADFAEVSILEQQGERVAERAWYGFDAEPVRDVVAGGDALVQHLIAGPAILSVPDWSTETRLGLPVELQRHSVGSTLALLVRQEGCPPAAVAVHFMRPREFGVPDQAFLEICLNVLMMSLRRRQFEVDLRASLDAVHEVDRQRGELARKLVSAQEDERGRIAADVHDDAVQVMTAANMRLELLRRHLSEDAAVATVEKLQRSVELSIARLRRLIFELRPPELERDGLTAAVRTQLEQLQDEGVFTFELSSQLPDQLDVETQLMLYRICQEALVNTRKHARASLVKVRIDAKAGGYEIEITDNGLGFDPGQTPSAPGHMGLASMRERAELWGGWCRVSGRPGEGTVVRAWLPAGGPPALRLGREPA